jgi:lysophospholipase L1-like esterase
MMLMKNKIIKLAGLALSCAVISACDTDFNNPVSSTSGQTSGTADFTTFVSIGDSLTAGYADSALYLSGQQNSYPAILAQQFAKVGGGTFSQPEVSDNLGGLLFGGVENPSFGNRLVLNLTDPENPSPEPIAGTPTTEVIGSGLNGTAFNNMGVPGAKSFHLVTPNYGDATGLNAGTANPYFVRFSSSAATTMITDAAAQMPSFFVLWVGNNDVLSYATTGGIGTDRVGNFDPATYGSNDITDPTAFAGVYSGLVGAFTTANAAAKGVLVNIPDVATIPYFTTVPYNAVPLDEETATALNAAYAAYNGGLQAAQGLGLITEEEVAQRTIVFAAGQNAVVIQDEDLTDITVVDAGLINMRQATASDLLVLTASSKIGTLADSNDTSSIWGVGVPLEDGDVLVASEIASINAARLAFNATIQAAADADANLLLFDAAAVMTELQGSGVDYGTGYIDSTYATGGGFSLDGVHPTARGYAVIANEIIDTINTGFSANIPPVDPGDYTTIFVK